MFSKVLKHDFISTGRIMGVIYLIVAGITAFTLGSHYLKKGDEEISLGLIGENIGMLALLFLSIAMFVLTVVVVLVDFHKSLYGDQGYLTFTLPVESWKILLSKAIVSAVWFVIALADFFASMWIIIVVIREEVIGEYYDIAMSMFSQFSTVKISTLIASIVIRIIIVFIAFAFFTLAIFFTSTLANTRLFQKRSVLWTILLFIPILPITIELSQVLNQNLVFAIFFVDDKIKLVTDNFEYQSLLLSTNGIDIGELFVYLILGTGLFFATHYIMSKKVNIK